MNDDNPPPKDALPGSPEEDADSESGSSPRMYDFSADLNISPVTDDQSAIDRAEPKPQPPKEKLPINRLEEQPAAKPLPPIQPKPPVPPRPSAPVPPKPVVPVPPSQSSRPIAPKPIVPPPIPPKPAAPIVLPPVVPPPPPKPAMPPAPPVPQKPPASVPSQTSYREPIEVAKEWPFAFNQVNPGQPHMGQMSPKPPQPVPPSGPAPAPAPSQPAAAKSSPSNAPVKTILSGNEAGDQEEDKNRPATNLQRDVLSILPNLKKNKPEEGTPPVPSPLTQAKDGGLKPLRTYEGDVAEVLSHRRTSTASIAIAENKKATGEERIVTKPEEPAAVKASSSFYGKLFFVLLSIALIVAGGIGGYYLYTHSLLFETQQPAPVVTQAPQSFIPADSQALVGINKLDSATVVARVAAEIAKPQDPGTVKEIIPINMTAATPARMNVQDMTKALKLAVPDILLRTLQPSWMLGVYEGMGGDKHPFVVLSTDFFQNALSGMLQWEPTMAKDLKPYITDPASTSTPSAGQFKDEIVQNKDVRAYVTSDGQTLFAYSFVDNSTLVFASDDIALDEIATRLESRAFVR